MGFIIEVDRGSSADDDSKATNYNDAMNAMSIITRFAHLKIKKIIPSYNFEN